MLCLVPVERDGGCCAPCALSGEMPSVRERWLLVSSLRTRHRARAVVQQAENLSSFCCRVVTSLRENKGVSGKGLVRRDKAAQAEMC